MDNNNTFKMTYSAQQQQEIQDIRSKYIPKEPDKMERLRQLDAAVSGKATARSIAVGVVGTLILGLGMSFVMSDFGAFLGNLALPVGIGTGILGMGILALAYPLYQRTLKRERARIAPEILKLSDELMQ